MASLSPLFFVILLAILLVVESGAVSRRHRHHKLRAGARLKLAENDPCLVLGEGKEDLICIEVGPSVNNALPPMQWKSKNYVPVDPLPSIQANRELHANDCPTCEACWDLAIGDECPIDGDDGEDVVSECQAIQSAAGANNRISCGLVADVVNVGDVVVQLPQAPVKGALGDPDTVHVSVLTFNQENQDNHGSFPALAKSIENQGILSDVVVFCEQEARSDDGSYLADKVAPLLIEQDKGFTYVSASSERMVGMTGGTINYQKVSVMHHLGTYTHVAKGTLGVDVFEGKGGVFTEFDYTSPPARGGKTFRVSVICAHLNAKKPAVREENVHEVLQKFLKDKDFPAPSCKKGAKYKECYRQWLVKAKAQLAKKTDHVIVFAGDLNHRIRLWDHKSPAEVCDGVNLHSPNCVKRENSDIEVNPTRQQIADILSTEAGRRKLIALDAIHSGELGHAAQWAEDGKGVDLGYGFSCNMPGQNLRAGHTVYPPTYKRDYKAGSANCLRTAHIADPVPTAEILKCYYPSPALGRCSVKGRQDGVRQDAACDDKKVGDDICVPGFFGEKCKNHDMKKGELQLGWLDRVCFKANQGATVTIKEDVGLPEVTTADHYPVLVQMELKHP